MPNLNPRGEEGLYIVRGAETVSLALGSKYSGLDVDMGIKPKPPIYLISIRQLCLLGHLTAPSFCIHPRSLKIDPNPELWNFSYLTRLPSL